MPSSDLKQSASKVSPTISLMGGYSASVGNFTFITEGGVDLISSTIGSNDKKELELKNNFHFYITEKIGYKFEENMLTYITLGVGVKDAKVTYKDKISAKGNLTNMILGVGNEFRVMKNKLGIFTEFNNVISLNNVNTKAGDVKLNSYQFKIGARYYF